MVIDHAKHGLDNNQSYTIINAKTIELDDCSEEDLIQIRNPFGMKEWSGDWSDDCKKWTVKTRE